MKDKNNICLAHFLFPDRNMNENVTNLLHNSSTAERICRLKYSDEENVKDVFLQVHKDRTLIFCNNKPGASPCELNYSSEVVRACFLLFNYVDQKVTFDSEVPALLMSKRRYDVLFKDAHSTSLHRLTEYLAEANGDEEHSHQLARIMKSFIEEGELSLCTRSSSGWCLQYATFIGDHSSGWFFRKSSDSAEDWMIAIPMAKSQLCASFTKWMLHATPVNC